MIKTLICALLFLPVVLSANDEELLARRIVESWQEQDFDLVVIQVRQFLQRYPESGYRDSFLVIIGDAYKMEGRFEEALVAYGAIRHEQLVEPRKFDCWHRLGDGGALLAALEKIGPSDHRRRLLCLEALSKVALLRQGEEKAALTAAAVSGYEQLYSTKEGGKAIVSAAELYRSCGNSAKAIELYFLLANKEPEKAEELLFAIGRLRMETAPEQALELFAKVAALDGVRRPAACWLQARLLFQLKRYGELVERSGALLCGAGDKAKEVGSLIGRSHYLLGDYSAAVGMLEPLLSSSSEKELLFTLVVCGYKLGLHEKMGLWAGSLPKGDPLADKAAYMLALAKKKAGENAIAEELLKALPSGFEREEEVLYTLCTLAYADKRWECCCERVEAFVRRYPGSSHKEALLSLKVGAHLRRQHSAGF